jgi:hypothetical protein
MAGLALEFEVGLVTTRKIAEKIKNWQSDESQKTRAGRFPGLPCEGHLVTYFEMTW